MDVIQMLTKEALEPLQWDSNKSIDGYLRSAEQHKKAGISFRESKDYSRAFVEFKRVETILMKISTHPEFLVQLTDTLRKNLLKSRHDISKIVSSLEQTLVGGRKRTGEESGQSALQMASVLDALPPSTPDDGHRGELPDNVKPVVARLTAVLEDVQRSRRLNCCRGSDAQLLLDAFQVLLDMPGLEMKFRRKLVVAAQRLSKTASMFPSCYQLQGVMIESRTPVAAGGFADIYKGSFKGYSVCLKVVRVYTNIDLKQILQQYATEAILWGQLLHPNVLPIFGLFLFEDRPCLVAPWIEYGHLMDFLSDNKEEQRTLLVLDVALGLDYLHDRGIVHGDLKAANILVNRSRRACLADFGLSGIIDSNILNWTSQTSAGSKGGTLRWQAPEILDHSGNGSAPNSKESDVYALGCVAYEVYTGSIPFSEIARESAVMTVIISGHKPSKPPASSPVWGPNGLTQRIWTLMGESWTFDPMARPTIRTVIEVLSKSADKNIVDRRPMNTELMTPARFRSSAQVRNKTPSMSDVLAILDRVAS